MTTTAQQRAIIEALGLSPDDLRSLAQLIEHTASTVLVRDIAEAKIAALPDNHRYIPSLRRLIEWAGDTAASKVTAADITAWASRAGHEALQRANARHGVGASEAFVLAARAAYTGALADGDLRDNPAADVELPARPASQRTALSCEQLRQAHLCLLAHSRDPDLDDLVYQLLRETACRRGGVIGLAVPNLAASSRTVRVIEKYGKDRWQPVSAHLVDRLLGHHAERGCGASCTLVLHRTDGGHLNNKWFESFGRRVQHLSWAAELGVTAHWLRHTTLTDIERLAGVRIAGAYAGHADNSFGVTGRYTKVALDELRLAHARLFFDDPADAANAPVRPLLFRRVIPMATSPIAFAAA
jgi:site-specific recombinase XerD